MKIAGTLSVVLGTATNKRGQKPIQITFEGENGLKLTVMGARYISGNLLNAQATLPDGRIMDHTRFSPELQLAVKQAFGGGTVIETNPEYQKKQTEEMEQRRKRAME